jgi:pimeloyl-ACP methyl ester carboxylesterase
MVNELPRVILLHGWGGSFASTFAANGWVGALTEAGRTVAAIDLPGHAGPASHDPAAYVDMAALVGDILPAGPLDLVGFSLGGKLALALGAREPARFRRMVTGGVGDNIFAPEPHGEAIANALELGINEETPPAVANLVRYSQASGSDPVALAAVLRRPHNPVLASADLAAISAELLLINGDNDRIATPDRRLRAALGDPAYVSLAGVDHLSLPGEGGFLCAAIAFLNAGLRAVPPTAST